MTDTAYLGEFEQLVLLSILRLGSDASGASVATELEEQAGCRARAALSTTLDRLEAKGLLRGKLALGGPERQSLPRRAYRVTPRRIAPRINHHG